MSYEGPELPVTPAKKERPRTLFYALGCGGVAAFLLIGLMLMLDTLNQGARKIVIDKAADLTLLRQAHVPFYPEATYDEETIRQIRAMINIASGAKGTKTDKTVIAMQVPADEKTTWAWYEKKLIEAGYKRTDKVVTIPVAGKQIIYERGVQRLAVQVMPDKEFPGKSIITFSWMLFAEPGNKDV
jgi:hypothetical protein